MSGPLLELRDLQVTYGAPSSGALAALRGVSLDLGEGEALGLLGESGSGKSTLARAVPGLLPRGARTRGSVRLGGRELVGLPERELRRLRGAQVASLFQEPSLALAPVRRVGDQIADAITAHGRAPRAELRTRVRGLLEQVGLDAQHAAAWPHQLSGGQRQRVALARAVAASPRLLIADEPTAGLDPVTRRDVLDLLASLRRTHGLALLLVSHDLASLEGRVERLAVLYAGRLAEEGPESAVREQPAHPYTRGLLAALPLPLRGKRERPRPIPGQPPPPGASPPGCSFEPRCPDRLPRCREAPPPTARPAPGRRVECVLHDPGS